MGFVIFFSCLINISLSGSYPLFALQRGGHGGEFARIIGEFKNQREVMDFIKIMP
jgi:hypothetical protein